MSEIRTVPVAELKAALKRTIDRDTAQAELGLRLSDVALKRTEINMKAAEAGRALLASERRQLEIADEEEAVVREALEQFRAMTRELRNVPRIEMGYEPGTYRPDSRESFFRDLCYRHTGNTGAEQRVARHAQEQRAMTTASGSGVGLVPPQYIQDQIALYARAGRVTADRFNRLPLPDTGVSFNIPRVTTGTATAVQSSEAGAVNDSSPVTDDITLAVNTVAGKVDMSRQLADRSSPQADQLIAQDLAADFAKQLDTQVLNQATNGLLNLSGTNAITFTSGTPTVPLLWPKLADAVRQIAANRFQPADSIIMDPLKWGWVLSTLDSQNRPLVSPEAGAFNPVGISTEPTGEGAVGRMQGLPVFVDGNVPTNLGAGTNESWIVVLRGADHVLFEDPAGPRVRVFEEVLSGNLQVRILLFQYIAFSAARYPKATSIIKGTGTITPSL
jgi:HK97 family phage major capsid protein